MASFKNLVQTQLSVHQEPELKQKQKKEEKKKIIAGYSLEEMIEANSLIIKVLLKEEEKLAM